MFVCVVCGNKMFPCGISYIENVSLLPPPRRLCFFSVGLFACLFVSNIT